MRKGLILPLMIVLLATMASAATVDITPKKVSFTEGDMVEFDYTISSTKSEQVTYIAEIMCGQGIMVPYLEEKKADISRTSPFRGTFAASKVTADTEPQTCKARVTILKPTQQLFEEDLRVAAKPAIDLGFKTCSDARCTAEKVSFVKGSTIFLSSSSRATATVTFPSGRTQTVSVPGSFSATDSGIYKIAVSATKSGFKSFSSMEEIAVTSAEKIVGYADFSAKFNQQIVRPVFATVVPSTEAPTAQPPAAAEEPEVKQPVVTTPKKQPSWFRNFFFTKLTGFITKLF